MKRPTNKRILLAVFVGLIAAGAGSIGLATIYYSRSAPGWSVLVAIFVMAVSVWAIAAPIVSFAVRKMRSATVFDAVAGMTVLFAAITLAATTLVINRGPIDRVTGEPCGDNGERKVVTSMRMTPSGNQETDWLCLSREEFAARNVEVPGYEFLIVNIFPSEGAVSGRPTLGKVLRHFAESRAILHSLLLGAVAGLVCWICLFGTQWRIRFD